MFMGSFMDSMLALCACGHLLHPVTREWLCYLYLHGAWWLGLCTGSVNERRYVVKLHHGT